MNPAGERLVRVSWNKLAPAADRLSAAFYERLFEIDPDVRASFASVDMQAQRKKFMDMISEVVRVLDEPERLVTELAGSGRRHVDYGATDRGYQSVGSALLWSLERELGEDFTPELKEAWLELFGVVSGVMRRAGEKRKATKQ